MNYKTIATYFYQNHGMDPRKAAIYLDNNPQKMNEIRKETKFQGLDLFVQKNLPKR